MINPIDWKLLARFISGDATAADKAEVERWAAGDPDRPALLRSLAQRWDATRKPARSEYDVDKAWQRLTARLNTADRATHDRDDVLTFAPPRRWTATKVLLPLAAMLVIAAGIALIRRGFENVSSLGTGEFLTLREARSGVGQRLTVDLPDSSRILLGAVSTVRVDANRAGNEQHVYLSGQGLFQVRHDARRRFVVHAAGTVTEDLGTEFDVRAYPGDSVVRVTVREGVVAVRRDSVGDTSAVLRANDVGRVDQSGTMQVLHDQNVDRLLAWTTGEIAFDNAPLSTVATELQRWFDIECRFADSSLAQLHLTTTKGFRGETLDEILRVVETSVGVRAVKEGRVVTFSRARADSNRRHSDEGTQHVAAQHSVAMPTARAPAGA